MVAGLTADVFVQLTATLAHLSSTLNKTNSGGKAKLPFPFPDFGSQGGGGSNSNRVVPDDNRIDPTSPLLLPLPVRPFILPSGSNASLRCPQVEEESFVSNLEWLCYGCQQEHDPQRRQQQQLRKVAGFGSDGPRLTLVPPKLQKERVRLHAVDYELQFWPLRPEDEGDYFCLVNGRERPTGISRLMVQDVPDPPGRPLVDSFTSRSVNLSWTPPLNSHHSAVTHYLVHQRKGEDGNWQQQDERLSTKGNNTLFQVTGLQPFTTYSFRVTAVNALGRSKPSMDSYYTMTLRTVPTERPVITSAHNVSSTSVLVSWRAPPSTSLNGEHLGYRLAYRRHHEHASRTEEDVRAVNIKDPEAREWEVQGLQPFTRYIVSVQVVNPEGLGPASTVEVSTDEGVPSMPLNVRAIDISNSTVRLSWERPANTNGVIIGYRLYFMRNNNFTDVVTVRLTGLKIQYTLIDLVPYTKYKFWLKAFTWKNEGESSDPPLTALTDVIGPSEPHIVNLTCKDDRTVFLEWEKPRRIAHSIDFYFISYESEEVNQYQVVSVDSNTKAFRERKIQLANLSTNALYIFTVRGATLSLYEPDKIFKGPASAPQQVHLRMNCDHVKAFTVLESEENQKSSSSTSSSKGILDPLIDLGTGAVAGVALVAMVLILVVVAFVLKRKLYHDSLYYVSDCEPGVNGAGLSSSSTTVIPLAHHHHHSACSTLESGGSSGTIKVSLAPISISVFLSHVENLRRCDGFVREFSALQEWERKRMVAAAGIGKEDCHHKSPENRYANIVPYEHSRVRLQPLKGKKSGQNGGGEYINASFIDGEDRAKSYIATQGPMPSNFALFWRMVWEQRVRVVVAMTNLVEGGQVKCDQYWPSQGTENYGTIQVTLSREDVFATHTVRTFKLWNTGVKCRKQQCESVVQQFHFTHWGDRGVPDDPLPALSFVRKSSHANREADSPLVVHCSAGVGRTGVYILIDAMLKRMKTKGELNVLAYLRHIRTQRNFMVQTEEQYIFVHDALAEAVASGETNINRSYLPRYIHSLQSNFTTDENAVSWRLLDSQFNLLTSFAAPPNEAQYGSALMKANRGKNRSLDFVPVESSRVSLSQKPGATEGSDYINASWFPGFRSLKEFIVAQHPAELTAPDFWTMVWEQTVQAVVVLSSLRHPEFTSFWPKHETGLNLGPLCVRLSDERVESGIQTKCFTLHSEHSEQEHSVRLIFSPGWPQSCSSLAATADLVRFVQGNGDAAKRPVVVVDEFGATEAATFCTVSSLLRQLDYDNHSDVYLFAKAAHAARPGVWRGPNDLLRIYKILEAFLEVNGYKESVEDLARQQGRQQRRTVDY